MSDTTTDLVREALRQEAKDAALRANECRRQAEALVATLLEYEVRMLRHITAGLSKRESAALFGVSLQQFERRRAILLAKLKARSTADAVRVGIYAGLD